MTKRLVDIDDDLLARVRSAAGTDTIKATVDTALKQLVDHEKVLRHLDRLRGTGALDLETLAEARRPSSMR
jgi:Arc/MetJ family transcription regulator